MPNADQRWISYAEFGERFVRRAVTAERISTAVSSMADRGMTIGPYGIGPLGLASVRAEGKVSRPVVTQTPGTSVSFGLSVPVTLELVVILGGQKLKLGALVEVNLQLHTRTAEPLLIVIDIPAVGEHDVRFTVRAEAIGAAFESVLDPVSGLVKREVAARVNGMLTDRAAVQARVFDVGAAVAEREPHAPLPPYRWNSYADFGHQFFELAVTAARIEQQLKELDGRPVAVGPIQAGPRGFVRISVDGQLGLPRLSPLAGAFISYGLHVPVGLTLTIKALRTGRFSADIEIPLAVTARASAGSDGSALMVVIDIPPPAASEVKVSVRAHNFWARRIGAHRVRAQLAAQVAAVVTAELESGADRSVDIGAIIDQATAKPE